MKILDLFGIGGSFTEFYLTDYKEDVLLMGHDGPGHTRIAEGRTKVRPLDVYHGKVGRGLSVEMRVKQGPVTFYYEKRAIKLVTPTTEPEAQSINDKDKSKWLQTRPGERCRVRISAADTNGAYSVVEIVSDARDGTPMHIHQNEDEHFIILEGTARIASGDKTFDAAAGTAVTLSKGVPHAWCNLSGSPLRMAVIASPGGIEEILQLIAKGGDVDIKALSEKFGVRNVSPMLSS